MKQLFTQSLLYLIEVGITLIVFTALFSKIENGNYFDWGYDLISLQFITNAGLFFVIYQILIYTFLSLESASKNDTLIQLGSMIKMALLHSTNNQPLEPIKTQCEVLLNKEKKVYMISKKHRNWLKSIDELIVARSTENITQIEFEFKLSQLFIFIEHDKEFNNLLWRNSILLRITK